MVGADVLGGVVDSMLDDVGDDGRISSYTYDRGGVGFQHVRADAGDFVVGT